MKKIIEMKGVEKVFSTEEVDTYALKDIDLSIDSGEYVSISGPSGCGKSTLLSILGLLDSATSGTFKLNDTSVLYLKEGQKSKIRNREVGFIFQSFNLISDLTVEENVALPLTYQRDISKEQRKQMVTQALEKVDMSHRKVHYPAQLSGGQQQRVAVARAIVGNPSLILADEPTGNLDSSNAEQVMTLLDRLHAEGATICMVTHDPRYASHAERIVSMLDGKIISDLKVSDIEFPEQLTKSLSTLKDRSRKC